MAHKKGQGSTSNGRDSRGQRLGVKRFGGQAVKAGEILERLFTDQPNHPGVAHYIIHSYDYPELAKMGLSAARSYAEIAPSSSHAQHMPSHIFTRLGLWEESISTNINSASSATCYAESIAPGAHWDEEVHAIDIHICMSE